MDKNLILEEIILKVKQNKDNIKESYEYTKETTITAPSRMQSRYDTRGIEMAWVADGLAKRYEDLNIEINLIKQVDLVKKEQITIGSLVSLEDLDSGEVKYVFLLPGAGGTRIQYEGKIINVVTPLSPVGAKILGQSEDYEFKLIIDKNKKEYVVDKIN